MTRGERRYRTEVKLKERERLKKDLGLQGGTVYERHRNKINKSISYMRDGNVTHYVSPSHRSIKTRCKGYRPSFMLPHRDTVKCLDKIEGLSDEDR